jgi:hypothetical protein
MNQNEGKLKRVESESELKVGDGCVLKYCNYCKRDMIFNISKISKYTGKTREGKLVKNEILCYISYHRMGVESTFLGLAIREGRLFKIIDDAPKEVHTNVVVEKAKPKRTFLPLRMK